MGAVRRKLSGWGSTFRDFRWENAVYCPRPARWAREWAVTAGLAKGTEVLSKSRGPEFEKRTRNQPPQRRFTGGPGGWQSRTRNGRIANGSSKKRVYSEGILRLLKKPGNAGFPGRFFSRILSDPAQLYKSLLKISIFYYLRHKRWPKMSL